jgi:Fe-S cluster biogenesis protein NfuA
MELRERIERLVNDEVLPLLRMDGTAIEVVGVEEGIVQVRLSGACGSCPGSVQVVVMGIEEELRRRLPEVAYLEVVP